MSVKRLQALPTNIKSRLMDLKLPSRVNINSEVFIYFLASFYAMVFPNIISHSNPEPPSAATSWISSVAKPPTHPRHVVFPACPGSSPRYLPGVLWQKHLTTRCPGDILVRTPNHLSELFLIKKSSSSTSKWLLTRSLRLSPNTLQMKLTSTACFCDLILLVTSRSSWL